MVTLTTYGVLSVLDNQERLANLVCHYVFVYLDNISSGIAFEVQRHWAFARLCHLDML